MPGGVWNVGCADHSDTSWGMIRWVWDNRTAVKVSKQVDGGKSLLRSDLLQQDFNVSAIDPCDLDQIESILHVIQ